MKKIACAALSTALLASMLAACGSSASTTPAASSADTSSDTGASSTEAAASTGAAADGSLHVAMNTDIQTMDVHKTNNDYMVPLNIFDRLFEIKTNADGSTELEKSLVEDYTVSDDGLTYDFTLRSGVTFSDGTPLTANEVYLYPYAGPAGQRADGLWLCHCRCGSCDGWHRHRPGRHSGD